MYLYNTFVIRPLLESMADLQKILLVFWFKGKVKNLLLRLTDLYLSAKYRAQPDITSGPEVRQIFKCPDFRFFSFPDSGPLKIEKKFKKKFQHNFFCLSLW